MIRARLENERAIDPRIYAEPISQYRVEEQCSLVQIAMESFSGKSRSDYPHIVSKRLYLQEYATIPANDSSFIVRNPPDVVEAKYRGADVRADSDQRCKEDEGHHLRNSYKKTERLRRISTNRTISVLLEQQMA